MKKIIISLFCLLLFVGCSHKPVKDSDCESDCGLPNNISHRTNLKTHYEKLNDTMREVDIDENNNFVPISINELNDKLVNKEDMLLFISSNQCPYCRSVIETADKVSRELGVYDIFTVEAWDKDKNEIFRDEYVNGELLENNDVYSKLLELDANNLLVDWVKDGEDLGRKRIYLPTFLYIENGEILFMEMGVSDLQTEPNQELTDEIKEDMYNKLYTFFEKCPRG